MSFVRSRGAAWNAVGAVVVALAVIGCADSELRALHLTLRVAAAMPPFDYVQVSVGSMRGGDQFQSEDFRLAPADFDAAGSYSTVLLVPAPAEEVDVLAEVHSGNFTIGHGRRTVVTLEAQGYDLEVEVVPTPRF
jgi:hypothetical protein